MPQTLQSPANILTSVDWFKAKLQFEIGPVELDRLLEHKISILVVDVRDRESYLEAHIPGAVNIPLAELPRKLGELPREKTIVTYCWSPTCMMSAKAALELAHRGYNVQELLGGIKAWTDAGRPIENRSGVSGRA